MQRDDEPTDAASVQSGPAEAPRAGAISVALLATLALVPLVVAAGFLSDRGAPRASAPDDFALMSLRGAMDADRDRAAPPRTRAAGF